MTRWTCRIRCAATITRSYQNNSMNINVNHNNDHDDGTNNNIDTAFSDAPRQLPHRISAASGSVSARGFERQDRRVRVIL